MIFPLRLKLALFATSLLVVGIALVATLLYNSFSGALENEARKRGRFIAENLAQNARQAILLEDDVVLGKLLDDVANEAEVVGARLLNTEGATLGSTLPGEATLTDSASAESAPLSPPRMTLAKPFNSEASSQGEILAARMIFQKVDLGEAQIILDLDAVVGSVVQRSRRDLYFASGGMILFGVIIAIIMSGRITRPLSRLRLAVQALAKGDTTARVEVRSRDELAILAQAFNNMSASLSEKRRVESAFRSYVSDHVLKQIIDQPDAIIIGERREITVLFIDIRQFTRMANKVEPEPLVAFLNDSFELVTERLLEHGATVDKYLGDAVLAYFGAPIESPEHPERAVAAAIAVQRSVEERNKTTTETGAFRRLDLGIGIQTGYVIVGDIGTELKRNYTIIGDPVNVAERLQKLAPAGEIMLTGDVADRLGGRVGLESQGVRSLEGRDEPVEVFRVVY